MVDGKSTNQRFKRQIMKILTGTPSEMLQKSPCRGNDILSAVIRMLFAPRPNDVNVTKRNARRAIHAGFLMDMDA